MGPTNPITERCDDASSARAVAIGTLLREHRHLAGALTLLNTLLDDVCSGRAAPDFKLISLIIAYIDRFPEQFHHRKEELYLFARLRARAGPLPVLDRLDEEHRLSGKLLLGLQRCFIAYQASLPGATSDLVDCCAAYAQFHLEHMKVEENEMLSLAMRHLTDADWIEIERGFSANIDPMRGVATAAGFDTLRRSIIERLNPARRERLSRTLSDLELPIDVWSSEANGD